MLLQIIKRDFLRNKMITMVLFLFITLSALLTASAAHVIMELSGSLQNLLVVSKAPHFVQMHAGPIDRGAIEQFARTNPLVKEQQIVEMLGIDGANVFLGSTQQSEANSVMDIGFVRQNPSFDLLLNLENKVIQLSPGEIALPIYYMQQKNLRLGDTIYIQNGKFNQQFKIADFVRDVQMNPSIVSSKRFVLSDSDFSVLKEKIGEMEYLIEFRLTDLSKLNDFSSSYYSSNLPSKGPTIDYFLFQLLNALTDGIIAVVIILVSFLLMMIALLCLRFTIIATMDEDHREIGVMKAIGISKQDIRRIYLAKYIVMAALASVCGYLISLAVTSLFTSNISLYLGASPGSLPSVIVPILAVSLVFGMVVFFCRVMLKRLNGISAVDSIRTGVPSKSWTHPGIFSLSKRKYMNVNTYLGVKDLLGRSPMYALLLFVYAINVFIMIVPLGLLHTLQLPGFISYLGVGQSDIRIDLPQSTNTQQRFKQMTTTLQNDPDIEKFSTLVTFRSKVKDNEGIWQSLNLETGDFTVFPLTYISGSAPNGNNELALSDLLAKELEKRVNDFLVMHKDGKEQKMKISGIYQDITNGGRTAKANLSYDPQTVLWYVVALNVKPGVSIQEKIDQFTKVFSPVKITHLESYLSQTLGNTISQIKLITTLAITIALSLSALITSLFLKMLLAKDSSQRAIMRSIGFTHQHIQSQYLIRMLLTGVAGIILGILSALTIGQRILQVLGSFIGASNIQLEFGLLSTFILYPLVFLMIVLIITILNTRYMKNHSIAEHITE